MWELATKKHFKLLNNGNVKKIHLKQKHKDKYIDLWFDFSLKK